MNPANPSIRGANLARQRATLERVQRAAAGETWVMGRIRVNGPGEALAELSFPVTFGERPLPILGGGEATAESGTPRPYYYPRISTSVIEWQTDGDYYTGATLAIVAEGQPGQTFWATYAFVGIALTNGTGGAS